MLSIYDIRTCKPWDLEVGPAPTQQDYTIIRTSLVCPPGYVLNPMSKKAKRETKMDVHYLGDTYHRTQTTEVCMPIHALLKFTPVGVPVV